MEKIKILHVFATLNRGGAETLIMEIYRCLDTEKFQFDFIVHGYNKYDFEEEILRRGGKIFRMPHYKGFNHFTYVKEWEKFLTNNNDYSIVHGHMRSIASIYLKIAKKKGIKTIMHSHSTGEKANYKKIIKKIFMSNIHKVSDRNIACSFKAGKELFNNTEFLILENGINSSKFQFNPEIRKEIRENLDIGKDELIIGHVGRFDDNKNQEFILRTFKEIAISNKNVKLVLVGNGEKFNYIQDIIKTFQLEERVILTGSISNVNEYYNIMDVFIFPSKIEGFGIALLEAQANGLTCYISDAIPEEAIVSNCKTLNLSDGPYFWAEYIKKELDSSFIKRNEVAIQQLFVSNLEISQVTSRLEFIYQDILKKKVLYWGLSNNLGGIETYLRTIAKYSNSQGIKTDFLVCYPKVCFEEEIKNFGSSFYKIGTRQKNPIKFYNDLYQFFKKTKGKYDAVHFLLQSTSSIEPVFFARIFKNNVIVDSRSDYKGKNKITKFFIIINKKILPYMKIKRLAITQNAGKSMFEKSTFNEIPSAIDLSLYNYNFETRINYRNKLSLNDKFVIGHIGRFTYEKNHEFLIKVFERILKKQKNSILVLIGEGPLKQSIEQKIKDLNLEEKVLFLGVRQDTINLIQMFDVFLFPSHFEGLGRAVIEVQCLGVPIVTSTGVPKDIEITPLVRRISLEANMDEWVSVVLEKVEFDRRDALKSIEKAGYSIEKNIKTLSEIYFDKKM